MPRIKLSLLIRCEVNGDRLVSISVGQFFLMWGWEGRSQGLLSNSAKDNNNGTQ
ncbi:hypothetical protein D3C83_170090 [compost metagenome]